MSKPEDDPRYAAAVVRHQAAQHAMQSGVRQELAHELPQLTTEFARFLKHERVGINTALCDHSALVHLLAAKGLFTMAEYAEAMADEMEREVTRYEASLGAMLGVKVTL